MSHLWLLPLLLLASLSFAQTNHKARKNKKSKPVVQTVAKDAVVKSSATAAEVAKEAPPLAVPLTPVSPSNP
jgi:hypothetical protein